HHRATRWFPRGTRRPARSDAKLRAAQHLRHGRRCAGNRWHPDWHLLPLTTGAVFVRSDTTRLLVTFLWGVLTAPPARTMIKIDGTTKQFRAASWPTPNPIDHS